MTLHSSPVWDDTILPFQLDRADVRGRMGRVDGLLNDILSQHSYPAEIEALIAEAVLLTALIGQTIKLRWKLSLQIRGDGPARLIATDYFAPAAEGEPARIRAYASFDADRIAPDATPFEQIGKGYFAVLLDQGPGTEPYSGVTPLDGGSLAQCAQTYFMQSEQLPTRFSLSFGQSQLPGSDTRWRGGGIMLQNMPVSEDSETPVTPYENPEESENWNRANHLLATVEDLELIGPTVKPAELLYRLFHEEDVRVFDAQKVEFGCTCSEDRVRHSLSMYSAKDLTHMTTDEGTITADCQFCGAHYVMDPATVGKDMPLPDDPVEVSDG